MPDPPTNSKSMNPEISQILEPIRLIPTKKNTKTNSSTFGSLVLELVGGSGEQDTSHTYFQTLLIFDLSNLNNIYS